MTFQKFYHAAFFLLMCIVSAIGKKKVARLQECSADMPSTQRHTLAMQLLDEGRRSQTAGQLQKALEYMSAAEVCDAQMGDIYFWRGQVYHRLGHFEKAINDMHASDKHQSQYASEAVFNAGVWLAGVGDMMGAQRSFARAVDLNPKHALGWSNLGVVRQQLGKPREALKCYVTSIGLDPLYEINFFNLGKVLQELSYPKEAIHAFRTATRIRPSYFEALASWAGALTPLRQWRQASWLLESALKLQPDSAEALYLRIFAEMHICGWSPLDQLHPRLSRVVHTRLRDRQAPGVEPYAAITFPWPPADLLAVAEHHAAAAAAAAAHLQLPSFTYAPLRAEKGGRRRLHVGVKSYDIGDHQSSYLVVEVLTALARGGDMRLSIVSLRPDDGSDLRRAIASLGGGGQAGGGGDERVRFHDYSQLTTAEIVKRINEEGVHILVDLDAHFRNSRLEIMSLRPAPVQVLYPFFVGTAGAAFLPHMISDAVATPPDYAGFFSERLVLLPDSYYVNSHRQASKGQVPPRQPASLRAKEGLPEQGVVLANFNQFYKIDGATFASWMAMMRTVNGSTLWLRTESLHAHKALRHAAKLAGVAGSRIVFARWATTSSEHVLRSTLADLSLDTPLYNSMTTGCDMLWSGVPIVTMPAQKMVSRLGASLVLALGPPWSQILVSRNGEDYVTLATRLATAVDCVRYGRRGGCTSASRFRLEGLLSTAGSWRYVGSDQARSDDAARRRNSRKADQQLEGGAAALFDMEAKARQLHRALRLLWDSEAARVGSPHGASVAQSARSRGVKPREGRTRFPGHVIVARPRRRD